MLVELQYFIFLSKESSGERHIHSIRIESIRIEVRNCEFKYVI